MLSVLLVGWGAPLRRDLARLAGRAWGRSVLAGATGLCVVGVAAAGWRVAAELRPVPSAFAADELPPETYPRVDREAPELGLVGQSGERVDLASLRGRPALVTFAFAHCESVCPLVVREVVDAQRRLRERASAGALGSDRVPRIVVVTLDPWRDTPARLPHLARAWGLGDDAFALSGAVDEVNSLLDRWGSGGQCPPADECAGEMALQTSAVWFEERPGREQPLLRESRICGKSSTGSTRKGSYTCAGGGKR